jgi:hypothetical protein
MGSEQSFEQNFEQSFEQASRKLVAAIPEQSAMRSRWVIGFANLRLKVEI